MEGGNVVNNGTVFSGRLGYGSYIGENCSINGSIGKYYSVASDVNTIAGKHPTSNFVSTHPAFFRFGSNLALHMLTDSYLMNLIIPNKINNYSVIIGNDVWICSGATILEGVKIGDGVILSAGSLITKDVEPYAIYTGIPAKK